MKCGKCGSDNVKIVAYQGTNCIVCDECGYDEREELDLVPEDRSSQKAKDSFSPYKTGGPRRTQKK